MKIHDEEEESERGPSTGPIGTRWAFRELLHNRTKNLRDVEGRPLKEQLGSLEISIEQYGTEFVSCPYAGSRFRHERPMNVSALKQITSHWPEVTGGLIEVFREYRKRVPGDAPLSSFDLWRLVNTGILFPTFCAMRADGPYRDHQLPVWVAGCYKVLIGIHTAVRQLMMERVMLGEGQPDPLPTAEEMLEFLEKTLGLIGPREVCAGPPNLILRSLRVVLTGVPDASTDTAPFHETMNRPDDMVDFAQAAIDLFLLHFTYVARMRKNAHHLGRLFEAAGAGEDIRPLLETMEKEHHGHPVGRLSKKVEEMEGVDMNVLATRLGRKISLTPARLAGGFSLVENGDAQGALAALVQEELAAYEAEERAFLAKGTELARAALVALGHPADSEEVLPEDLFEVTGMSYGDLLREIRVGVPQVGEPIGGQLHAIG